MGFADSGNETLMSDESSSVDSVQTSPEPILRIIKQIPRTSLRDLQASPAVRRGPERGDGKLFRASPRQVRSRPLTGRFSPEIVASVLPPRIQPYSGFMGNGKAVIRPIAFKPLSGRLSSGGERYGSTPVLASRPGSHMTLYGSSSDVREARWCGSPQPASLSVLPPTSLPPSHHHHRHHSAVSALSSKLSSAAGGCGGEPVPAPSPADSGVSVAELEHASPRHCEPDHSDYSVVGSEERRARLRSQRAANSNLRARLRDPPQMTVPPSSGHDDIRARRELTLANTEELRARRELAVVNSEEIRARRELAQLRARLEDAEWALAQRAGEIALLKTQLRDAQNDQTTKGHEYLQLKAECRQLREALDRKDRELNKLRADFEEKDKNQQQLQSEVDRLTSDLMGSVADLSKNKETSNREIERLKTELKELRQELSDVSLSGYEGIECGRTMRGIYEVCKSNEYHWNTNDSILEDAEVQRLNGELPDITCSIPCPANNLVERLKSDLESKEKEFNTERRRWSEEKEKVLRYQKQLQLNYVQMFRKSRALEAQVESLRLELDLSNKGMKNVSKLGKTIEL